MALTTDLFSTATHAILMLRGSLIGTIRQTIGTRLSE